MADRGADALPRIALVYGSAPAARHLRDALAGLVEIAYAASADEFDTGRLAAARVGAALVNVDDGDWLERITTGIEAAGIPVLFNDPDVSLHLEGWSRARWLRHLTAKLTGSASVDPPRPVQATTGGPEAGVEDDFLDVDTESLSAMIDDRLAALGSPANGAKEVWIGTGPWPQGDIGADGAGSAASGATGAATPRVGRRATGAPRPDRVARALAPSDWKLMDPAADAPLPQPGATGEAPATPSFDNPAGLELLPLEPVTRGWSGAGPGIERIFRTDGHSGSGHKRGGKS